MDRIVGTFLYQIVSGLCRWRIRCTATLLCALTVAGLVATPAAALEIRVGHNAPVNDPRHKSLEDFADRVSRLSQGKLTVKVFPANTIGQDQERLELMQAGLLEMSLTGEILANFDSRWSIISMPYLWKDQAHLRRFLNSEIAEQWKAQTARSSGLVVFGFLERTPRILTTRQTPVFGSDDLKGLRIRVPPIPAYMDTWRAFGVEPTPMPSSDFYSALQRGEIDGMENPLEVMSAWRIHEVSKYISFTDHMQTSLFLVASGMFMNSLPADQREVLERAAREAEVLHSQRMQDLKEVLIRNLEAKGMVMIKSPDIDALKLAAQSVHQKYMSAFGQNAYDFIQRSASSEEP